MKRILWIVSIPAALLTTWLVSQYSIDETAERIQRTGRDDRHEFDRFQLEGFEHTQFKEGRKLFTLYCKEITHRKMKIGPLTVNPVKEIKMSKAHIQLFPRVDKGPPSDKPDEDLTQHSQASPTPIISQPFVDGLKKMLGDRELGFVSRIVIADFTLDVSGYGRTQARIHAGKATLGAESPDARLDNGFSIVAQNGQRLVADKAVWDQDKRAFHIPKGYVLTDEKGRRQASNAFFGIDAAGQIIQVP